MSVAFHDFALDPAPEFVQRRQIRRERPWGRRSITLPPDYLLLRDGPGGIGITCEFGESSAPVNVTLGAAEPAPILLARTLDWRFRVTCPLGDGEGLVEAVLAGQLWFEPSSREALGRICGALDGKLDPARFRDAIGRALFRLFDAPVGAAAAALPAEKLASRIHWQREIAHHLDDHAADSEALALGGFHLLGRDRKLRIYCDQAAVVEVQQEEEPSHESEESATTAPGSDDAGESPQPHEEEPAVEEPQEELTVQWWKINHAREWTPLHDGDEIDGGCFLAVDVELHRRDAWIQIFLLDSQGKLQRLVPDDEGILGVVPQHFQRAGVRRRWPGQVSLCPDLPYWKLDIHRGVERIWVVATDGPVDLRGSHPGRPRGFERPSPADVDLAHFFAVLSEREDALVSPWTFHHR